jgi:hypothetical protein
VKAVPFCSCVCLLLVVGDEEFYEEEKRRERETRERAEDLTETHRDHHPRPRHTDIEAAAAEQSISPHPSTQPTYRQGGSVRMERVSPMLARFAGHMRKHSNTGTRDEDDNWMSVWVSEARQARGPTDIHSGRER